MRREFSKAIKRAAFERAAGHCEQCGTPLRNKPVEYDHATADFMGGANDLGNIVVLCAACHKAKTSQDRPMLDRARRIVDKHKYGIRKRSTFPAGRDSRWKRKVDGSVVPR